MDSPINLARDYESRINCVMVMDVAIILKQGNSNATIISESTIAISSKSNEID